MWYLKKNYSKDFMSIFFFTEWRNQINQHTSFIDGSMVYGATDKDAKNLRTGYKGTITLLFFLKRIFSQAATTKRSNIKIKTCSYRG